jgi:LysM repeat protein
MFASREKKGATQMDFDQSRTKSRKVFAGVLMVLLIVTLLAGLLPQTNAGAVTCKFKHKVKQGETLIYVANLYGVGWEKVADANNLQPPYTVVEGQVLCIPEGDKPSGTETANKKNPASLQVVPGMNRILVSVENFSKKTTYFVRVTPTGAKVTFKLGHFTTNKEGDFTGWFRMPFTIGRTPQMTLCVKNAWTDAVSCIKYDDIFIYIPMIRGSCPPKEGR